MQVFSRKVWKDEKVREGGDTQTDVDEYFISQKVHTHISTQPMSSSHSFGRRISTANQQTIWSQIKGTFDRQIIVKTVTFVWYLLLCSYRTLLMLPRSLLICFNATRNEKLKCQNQFAIITTESKREYFAPHSQIWRPKEMKNIFSQISRLDFPSLNKFIDRCSNLACWPTWQFSILGS